MHKKKKLNYNALGFAEILITIMFVGIVATVLSRIAISSLQNLVRDERLDKVTQYASDSSAIIQNIANQGVAVLNSGSSAEDDESLNIEIFPKDVGLCDGYYYLVEDEYGNYELAHDKSNPNVLLCATGHSADGPAQVRSNCVNRNNGEVFENCAIPSEDENGSPQFFRYIHIDFPDDYNLATTDYVTAQITVGQIDNVNNEPTSKSYVADYTLYTSVRLNASKNSDTHHVSIKLKNASIGGNADFEDIVAGGSVTWEIEKDANVPDGTTPEINCTSATASYNEEKGILTINNIHSNMSCTISFNLGDEEEDDDGNSLCKKKVDTLGDCLIISDQGIRDVGEAKRRIASEKISANFYNISQRDEGLLAIADYSSKRSTELDGTSYYYRGAVPDNWVYFAGYLWRVVRINGDGSIRMIYSGTKSNHTGEGTSIGTSAFSSNQNDSKYLGYMYQTTTSNDTNSTIKGIIDNWYENESNLFLSEYFLSDSGFCGDRTSRNNSYGGVIRNLRDHSPSLECSTLDKYTLMTSGNGSLTGFSGYGNNALKHPIGLLTVDEVAYAGGVFDNENNHYYLASGQNYWLMSPGTYNAGDYGTYVGAKGVLGGEMVNTQLGIRPVINLNDSVLYFGGSGTETNPYIVGAGNTLKVVPKDNLVYTGEAYELVTVENPQCDDLYFSTETVLDKTNYKSGTSEIPKKSKGSHTVYYYCSGNSQYAPESGSVDVSIEPEKPLLKLIPPSVASISTGAPYSFIANVSSNTNIPGTLVVISNPDITITSNPSPHIVSTQEGFDVNNTYVANNANEQGSTITVMFTPDDQETADVVTRIFSIGEIKLTVDNTISVLAKDLTYTGNAQVLVTTNGAQGNVYYSITEELTPDNYMNGLQTIPTATKAGKYDVYWYCTGKGEFKEAYGSTSVTIKKATPVISLNPDGDNFVQLGGTEKFVAKVKSPVNCDGTLTAASKDSNSVRIASGESSIITATSSGVSVNISYTGSSLKTSPTEITVTFLVSDTNNFNSPITEVFIVGEVRTDYLIAGANVDTDTAGTLGNPEIQRKKIERIVTLTSSAVPNNAITSWDVSVARNGSVMAYVLDSDNNGMYELYIGQNGGVNANPNSDFLFIKYTGLVSADLSNLKTNNVNRLSFMFSGDSKLSTITGIGGWNVDNVVDMNHMFSNCSSLTSLPLNNWNTSKVTNMDGMFASCSSLSSLPIGNWNTGSVEDMGAMFRNCSALTSLSIGNWNVSSVVRMDLMFYKCSALTSLSIGNWNVSNVELMQFMFSGCESLSSLALNSWNTSKVTNMEELFGGCKTLSNLAISNWNVSKVTSMKNMFGSDSNLKALNINGWVTSSLKDMSKMFDSCSSLTSMDLSNWNTTNVTNMEYMFNGCSSLQKIDLNGWHTPNVTNTSHMFSNCGALKTIYADYDFVTTNITNSEDMFIKCDVLRGGLGTPYTSSHRDKEYARVDATGIPGYFTYGSINANVVDVPTSDFCVSRTYNGKSQTLTKDADPGFTFSNNTGTDAGSYTVKATLNDGYIWADNTTGAKTFKCSIGKVTPVITLSATSGSLGVGGTTTFTASVSSECAASVAGTLSVSSGTESKATVSPKSKSVTATQAGVATTITVTGVANGKSTITVSFAPSSTTNFDSAANKNYTATVLYTFAQKLIVDDYGSDDYNAAVTAIKKKSSRKFGSTATTDEGLHAIADYASVSATSLNGTSYYYRGAVPDNWVYFAGMLWRVIRINGDGSVRLIYNGHKGSHAGEAALAFSSFYNQKYDNRKYVGYMYDSNTTNSTVKGYLDNWYENNLKSSYESYIANEIFCNDRSDYQYNDALETNTYAPYQRLGLPPRTNINYILYHNPSLGCTNKADRFTLKVSGSSSIKGTSGAGNNKLDYPIGLITADEVSLAGGVAGLQATNCSYYLCIGKDYWTMTPSDYDSYGAYGLFVHSEGYIYYNRVNTKGIRPVINLKATVKYDSGKGTVGNPYTVKL
ncbi:BspA family leucine-rich repeat surface protein [bacterium]|nr:BspA family leucine-rich repeat surface protein [bacterium]